MPCVPANSVDPGFRVATAVACSIQDTQFSEGTCRSVVSLKYVRPVSFVEGKYKWKCLNMKSDFAQKRKLAETSCDSHVTVLWR